MTRLTLAAVTLATLLAAGAAQAQDPTTPEALTECASLLYAKSLLDTSDVVSEASVVGAMRLVERVDRMDPTRSVEQVADQVVDRAMAIFLEHRDMGQGDARLEAFWARNPSLSACVRASIG